ncbi:lysyl endopeptidase [Entomortierella parvispora]|uniref:Lysyl endopeptidase n=1 Tax=Entomortierella parvispora TaxID=205924 RepID=A0A9P3H411_9FUNG|nr:lysyl endopeptidase [Entomortierella parvispora]
MHLSAAVLLSSALSLLLLSSKTQHGSVNAQVSVPGRFQANYAGSLTVNKDVWVDKTLDRHPLYHPRSRTQRRESGAVPVLKLPAMDNVGLLNQEEDSQDGSYRFGKAITLDSFTTTDTLSSGRWIPLKDLQRLQARSRPVYDQAEGGEDDVLVWQLEIHSPSALSLNLIFSEFQLPSGTEFFVSGQRHTLGAFTAEINNKADKIFATAPVAGDRLLLEFFTPRKILEEGQRPLIQLSHVIHGYKPMLLAASSDSMNQGFRTRDGSILPRKHSRGPRRQGLSFQSEEGEEGGFEPVPSPPRAMSGKCNVDVACHLHNFHDQSRSVGVILSEFNQKYCTGALINNARQDGRQLFLTANHCTGFSDTSEHLVMFNHEKILCGSRGEEVNEHDTAQGLLKLGNYAPSDYTLYEILEPIPDGYNLYLSGWSAIPQAPSSRLRQVPTEEDSSRTVLDPIVGIHHPSGDSKKISFYTNGTLPKACWSECGPEEYFHWQIPRWTEGTTEPGSSGSPLFDADKRIVGQLHGGSASCWNPNGYDVYGGIHASFQTPPKIKNRLATYLDPDSTGAKTLDGYGLEAARRHHANRKAMEDQEEEKEEEKEEEVMVRVGPLGGFRLEKPLVEDEDRPQWSGKHSLRHPIHKGEAPRRLSRPQFSTEEEEDLAPRVIASLSQVWGRLFRGRVSIHIQEDLSGPTVEDENDF